MIRQIEITKIFQTNKDKEGNPLTGKFGPYYKIGLATKEFPLKYINGFSNKQLDWKAGDVVEIDLEEKGEYLNFKIPKKDDLAVAGLEDLKKRVKKLEETLEYKLAEMKADLVLELTGKVQTDSDYKKMQANDLAREKNFGIESEINGIPLDTYKDEPDF